MANTFKFGNGNWAVKDGSVLAYNDENNNFKPLPFDFTRDSIATRVNKDGLIEVVPNNMPRIDFTDNTSGHLLLEPSRTNTITYSEDFSDSIWTKSGPTLAYNQGISPDGKNNATKMIPSTSGTSQDIFATATASGSTEYTRSFFAKVDGYSWIYIQQYDGSTNRGAWFDLSTGSLGNTETNVASSIEDFGSGWYKCSVTFTTQSGATSERAQIRVVGANGSTTFAGNGRDGVLIWGAQVEQGSYSTSYIPTSGSTETRQADICNGSGNSQTFNSSEGVLYAEIAALANDLTNRFIILSDGSTLNRLTLRYRTTSNQLSMEVHTGGVLRLTIYKTLQDITESQKVALKYSYGDFSLWVNGTEAGSSSFSGIFSSSTINNLDFDGFSQPFIGRVSELSVFNEALTDEQLQLLTTP